MLLTGKLGGATTLVTRAGFIKFSALQKSALDGTGWKKPVLRVLHRGAPEMKRSDITLFHFLEI